jgi:hypothetical protein
MIVYNLSNMDAKISDVIQPVEAQEELSKADISSPQWALYDLVTAHYVSRAIYVAAKLKIADLLKNGPQHYSDLAAASTTDAPSLYRLLRLLTSAGVFGENEPGCFELTPISETLRTDIPGSRWAQALLLAGPAQQRSWSGLLDIIQTGKTPNGQTTFQFLAKYPEEGAIFDQGMAAGSAETAAFVAEAYDFSTLGILVDVGGGHGVLLRTILRANPAVRGVLFDLPNVVEGARKHIQAADLTGRCQVTPGDFFEGVPPGGDAYILKSVIHDWDDTRATAILRHIHGAMAPQGKLLLVEMVLPASLGRAPGTQIMARSDINMLVNLGGQERTDAEFSALLNSAGFRMTRIIPTQSLWSIVEGVREQQ